MNIEIFKDNFTADAIQDTAELKDCSGATIGCIDPSGIAEYYGGISKFSVADVMAYCFRRFGYPVNGWDDYKQLCMWIVKTPMPGTFLTITPCTVSPFGYLMKNEIDNQVRLEQTNDYRVWGKSLRDAAKKQGISLFSPIEWGGDPDENDIEKNFDEWAQKTFPQYYTAKIVWNSENEWKEFINKINLSENQLMDKFYQDKKQEFDAFRTEYEEANPFPKESIERSFYFKQDETASEIPYWKNLPETSVERLVCEAILRTVQDLIRPVPVRDWEITIDGESAAELTKYDDDGELIYDYSAPISDMAGSGVDPDIIGNEDWKKIRSKLRDEFGTVKDGLKYLSNLSENGFKQDGGK